MDESDQKPNQEESQNKETTATTNDETTATTNEEAPADLLRSELESLEKMVVEKLNSDETKVNIESVVINPMVSLAQGFAQSAKGLASKVEAKVETWSSVLKMQKQNGTEEAENSLPTSDEHVGESTAADTDNANNNGDHEQVPTTTEKQPIVGLTSWMNCCGLLEVLARPSDK